MKSRKSRARGRQPKQVRIAFKQEHVDVAREALEQAGVPTEDRHEAAALVFAMGLGVLTGHYNEVLATKLREAHIEAFGPEGPARFKTAALRLHVTTTMSELASSLLEGDETTHRHGAPETVQ